MSLRKIDKNMIDPEFTQEIDDKIEILSNDLEQKSPMAIEITRGSQLITVPKGTPVNVLNFTGKTVINLAPLFDSGLWTNNGGTTTVNSPSKITLVATANSQSYYALIPVKPNTTYTLSGKGTRGQIVGAERPTELGTISNYNILTLPSSNLTFTTGATTNFLQVYPTNGALGSGTFTFEDISLNEGTTAKEFVANVKGVTNPTIENKTTGESLTFVGTFHEGETPTVENGQAKVLRKKKEVVLDGSLAWTYNSFSPSTTHKKVLVNLPYRSMTTDPSRSARLIKYNGILLKQELEGSSAKFTTSDIFFAFDNGTNDVVQLSIQNTDSGWGETYTPTQAEIQAFMYGWKMYAGVSPSDGAVLSSTYNGTGGKWWVKVYSGQGTYSTGTGGILGTGINALPTVINDQGYNPYRLIHDLATPVTESVKTIGSLRLAEGDNTLELTEGRIVRERVKPFLHSDGANYIANILFPSSLLKNKPDSLIEIYKNGEVDTAKWEINTTHSNRQGNLMLKVSQPSFDLTAIYEVGYIPQEPYKVSAQTNPITINYRDTLGGVTEELVTDVSQLEERVRSNESVMGELIGGNSVYAKKTQEAWKTAVLQNGWSGTLYYFKDEFGVVHLQGFITSGTTTASTILFNLPVGYRPSTDVNILAVRANDNSYATVVTVSNGNVLLGTFSSTGVLRMTGSFKAI